jgi:hypothetical protein
VTEEKKELGRLGQFFADREGWDRFVDQVAAAMDRVPAAERASAAVWVGNYGEAGAIERLGGARGLVALSGHNNYWFWGPRGYRQRDDRPVPFALDARAALCLRGAGRRNRLRGLHAVGTTFRSSSAAA